LADVESILRLIIKEHIRTKKIFNIAIGYLKQAKTCGSQS
jgi:hypothetical protein